MRARSMFVVPALLSAMLAVLLPAVARTADAAPYGDGPDVASYQHPNGAAIDWAAVRRSGAPFGYVKATESTDYTNPYFADDWRAAAAAGMYRGTYHFARPGRSAATDQADYFAAAIGSQQAGGTLPPVLDLEDDGGLSVPDLQRWVRAWLTEAQRVTGRAPMIYTGSSFWGRAMGGTSQFSQYKLWIASYGVDKPSTPGWSTYTFWQYSSSATVDGISTAGATDVSHFNGGAEQMRALAAGGRQGYPWGGSRSAPRTPAKPAPSAPSRYVPLAPTRVMLPRSGRAPAGTVDGSVIVAMPASVPASSSAVVLEVSVVGPAAAGYLRVGSPLEASLPTALNFSAGHGATALVVTPMNASRQVRVSSAGGAVKVVADLVGFYVPSDGAGGAMVRMKPTRVTDTRSGSGVPSEPISGTFRLKMPAAVPSSATAVLLNVSALSPSGAGTMLVGAAGSSAMMTALTFAGPASSTGLALTMLSGGAVQVTVQGARSGMSVDVVGYVTGAGTSGSHLVVVAPERIADSRSGMGLFGPGSGRVQIGVPSVVPSSATAVLVAVTALSTDGEFYLRAGRPDFSDLVSIISGRAGGAVTQWAWVAVSNAQVGVDLVGASGQVVVDLIGYQTA